MTVDDDLVDEEPAEEPTAPVATAKWDPHAGPFSPHQGTTPPGYDEEKSPFDPANVEAMRAGFASHPNETYYETAMTAGFHFGKRLGLRKVAGLAFSRDHYEAVFWGPDGHPSKKSDG